MDYYHSSSYPMKHIFLFFSFLFSLVTNSEVFSQNANISINATSTTNGSWSGGTAGPYVFTPTANAATVLNTDIVDRLLGGGGFTKGNVTITTACGSCTDFGNITIDNIIAAANSGMVTPSLMFTAANTINVAASINLTAVAGAIGADNSGNSNATGGEGGMGGNGINISFSNSNPGGSIVLSNNASIITSGGEGGEGGVGGDLGGTGGDGGAGGNAGSITLLSQGSCIINSGSSLLANGGDGGAAGTPGGGGAPGIDGMSGAANDFVITGQNGITIAGDLIAIGATNGNFIINDGNPTVTTGGGNDGQTPGTILAGGNLIKNGSGTFFMGGNNTYIGTTTINAGTLRPTDNTVEANTDGPLGNNAGGLILNGGTIESNVTVFSRPITITGSGSRIDAYGSARTISSAIAVDNTGLNIGGFTATNAEGQVLTLSGVISGTVSPLTKVGTSEVVLSAANTFNGSVILETGKLDINNAAALGDVSNTFTIDSSTTIDNTSGGPLTTADYPVVWNGDFTFAGTNILNLGVGAVTINSDITITTTTGSLVIGGTINDATKNVTKAGAGSLAFGSQTITVNDLAINAGTLTSTSGMLNLNGNFTNNATFIHNGGTVAFNGNIVETIGGSTVTTFNDLTINNTFVTSPQIVLAGNETVAGILTLTQGNIDAQTNSTALYVSNDATGAISYTSGYVIGNLARAITNTGSPVYTYYLGTATGYTPVSITINSLSSGGIITGSATGGDYSNICSSTINPGLTVNDHWTFTNSGVTFVNYAATFSYPSLNVDTGVTAANFIVGKYSGSWIYPTISGAPTTTATSISNETTFGSFAIGDTVTNNISYASGSFCNDISSPQTVNQLGKAGGAYSSAAGLTLNSVSGAIVPGTSTPAIYTVSYTTPAGVCPAYTATTTVTIKAIPAAVINNITGSTVLDCSNAQIDVDVTPGAISYIWSGGNSTASAANSFIAPNTYSLTVTASNGCQNTANITITQDNALPDATISVSNAGGTTVLDCNPNTAIYVDVATGAATYVWSGGSSPSTAANSFTFPGTYSITITGSNGCQSTANIAITQNTVTVVAGITNNTGTTVLDCFTPSVNVTATGGATYEWSGGDAPFSATNSFTAPNLYFVKVIGSNGCFAFDSILITQTIAGITYTSNALTCVTNTVGVRATGGITYSWSGGNTPATDTNTFSVPGIYTVTVTAASGCIMSDSITVIVDTLPVQIINTTGTTVLDCSNTFIFVEATGDSGFSWSGGSSPSSNENTFTSPGTYSVTAITTNGCGNSDVITITEASPAPIPMSITVNTKTNGVPTTVLSNQHQFIDVTATGGTSYSWSGGTSTASANNTFTTVGTYSVTSIASPGCGVMTGTIQITQLSATVSLLQGNDTSCIGEYSSFTFVAVPVNAGASPGYQWRVNGSNVGTSSSTYTSSAIRGGDLVDVIVIAPTLSVTATSNLVTMIINPLPPKPVITSSGNALMSSAASGNQWYLNGIMLSGATSQFYPVTQAGFYAVEVTDAGCKAISDIATGIDVYTVNDAITVYPNPFVQQTTVSLNEEVKNATIKVVNLSGATVKETSCSGGQATVNRNGLEAGVYFIQVITDGEIIANKKVIIQ
jgi:autotransporter-associated beta strand protein